MIVLHLNESENEIYQYHANINIYLERLFFLYLFMNKYYLSVHIYTKY